MIFVTNNNARVNNNNGLKIVNHFARVNLSILSKNYSKAIPLTITTTNSQIKGNEATI